MNLAWQAYDRAVWGALGGLLGWLLFGVFGDAQAAEDSVVQHLVGGACMGGAVGYCLAGGTALYGRLWLRGARLAVHGLTFGLTGGVLGFRLGNSLEAPGGLVLGWGVVGFMIGNSQGFAMRAPALVARGVVAGTVGGLTGGSICVVLLRDSPETAAWTQPFALMLAGSSIGIGMALAECILVRATVSITRGAQAGVVYPLFGRRNFLGRGRHVAVPLAGAAGVEEAHASIERVSDRFVLTSVASPPERTRWNEQPLTGPRDLKSGDRIRLGDVELVFWARLARARRAREVEPPSLDAVAKHPFDVAPFEGVPSVRELAAKMQAAPHRAEPLLAGGVVAAWFERNGWGYPVRGALAPGLAIVQQFFETIGVAQPPPVALAPAEAEFECSYPERLLCTAALQSTTRKWVYAEVASTATWLAVVTSRVSGAGRAAIEYEIDSRLLAAGRRHTAQLIALSNGGQQLTQKVHVLVHRPHEPFTRRLLRPLLLGGAAGMLLRLGLALPGEGFGRLLVAGPEAATTFEFWAASPLATPGFVRRFVLASCWWTPLLVLVRGRRLGWRDIAWSLVAASGAGVALAATAACAVPVIDGPPRELWRFLGEAVAPPSSRIWLPLWVVTVTLWWTFLGALLNLLALYAARRP